MSDDSKGVDTKNEDQDEKNEEEEMSKCKKIKISNNDSGQTESHENVDTKSEISEAPKDVPESTDSVNSGDSSTNNSDNTSNGSEKVELASSNVPECTDSDVDIPEDAQKQKSDNSNVEPKECDSVIKDNNQLNKPETPVKNVLQNESSECSDSVTDNEKIATSQVDSEDKNDESKTSTNSLKNGKETLYELLNNPEDIQDNVDCNIKEKTEAPTNSDTEKTDVVIQSESTTIEIKTKNDDITCEELFNILQEKDKKKKERVLIIDVRNDEEYCKSRMSFHDNLINIPAEKIQPNKVPGYYRYILLYDIEAEKKYTRRSHNDIIVLVDKNSELETMDNDSPIAIFKNSLEEFDVHIDYKRIAVLRGGFEEWTKLYPNFTTKS